MFEHCWGLIFSLASRMVLTELWKINGELYFFCLQAMFLYLFYSWKLSNQFTYSLQIPFRLPLLWQTKMLQVEVIWVVILPQVLSVVPFIFFKKIICSWHAIYKVSLVFRGGFGVGVKKLWLTGLVKAVMKDAAQAYSFSGSGNLGSSAPCARTAVALGEMEWQKALRGRPGGWFNSCWWDYKQFFLY